MGDYGDNATVDKIREEAEMAYGSGAHQHGGSSQRLHKTADLSSRPQFSRSAMFRTARSCRTGTACSIEDFRLPYESRLNRELFIQHTPEVTPLRLRTILPGMYAEPPSTAGVDGSIARPPRPFPLNAPGASRPKKVLHVKPYETKTADPEQYRMFTTAMDTRNTGRWVQTLEHSEQAELEKSYLLQMGERAKVEAAAKREAAWRESRKMGTHDWRDESFRWYLEQCDKRKAEEQHRAYIAELTRQEESRLLLAEPLPNKTKSTLMTKPERHKGTNINRARQDALALLEGQVRDKIDTSIPTQELLLVPLKKKKKSYERRMQRSQEAVEHHQQAGMLSPGSGYANFPASPMPHQSGASRQSQQSKRTGTPTERSGSDAKDDGAELGTQTKLAELKADVGDPMTTWGFVPPSDMRGTPEPKIERVKKEKGGTPRRPSAHVNLPMVLDLEGGPGSPSTPGSKGASKPKASTVTDLARMDSTSERELLKATGSSDLGAREGSAGGGSRVRTPLSRRQTIARMETADGQSGRGVPPGAFDHKLEGPHSLNRTMSSELEGLEAHRAGAWRVDPDHQRWLAKLARRKKQSSGMEKSMKKCYKQFQSVVDIINRRQYMAGWGPRNDAIRSARAAATSKAGFTKNGAGAATSGEASTGHAETTEMNFGELTL
mmetsp:Transcript_100/g.227  ORF Transcript_100/g.227 Transcript_100/m.227 type:complete len:664 (-) Transcript_100:168-2159(-)|eukprot:CAMPEP_0118930704 /NCGR_PEP_ID=MMETSP1169-20130426/7298_1 /TAXON_ID=36882 /ORGANISM="Pyramimonas obovata, Strain CCMP722" /LENGTH=663 /DNA_ID=CAMNT_0006873095 /DNA_START=370 /DNA_END=2361 /DNA_ORIENTATION=+